MIKAYAVCAVFLLSACASIESPPVEEEIIVEKTLLDGIWEGSFDIRGRGPYDFYAIHVNGRSTAVTKKAKALCVGKVELNDGYYYAKYNLFALDGAPFDYATLTGTLTDGRIDSHFVTLNGGDTGSLTISYNPIYEQKSSLTLVAGEWSFIDRDGLEINIVIDEQGKIVGSDSDQCAYSGKVEIINRNYNVYDMLISITECGSVNGDYKGMGYLEYLDLDYFRIDFANEYYGFHYDLQKESLRSPAQDI